MRRCAGVLLVVGAVALLVGCSGRTTGATNVTATSATLNFVASCGSGEQCSWYVQYRVVKASSWTPVPSTPRGPVSGPVSNVALSEQATGLTSGAHYEYQVCGNSKPGNAFVCVGPDGTSSTTQRFVATAGSTDWPQFHYEPDLSGNNPFEVTLNSGNVSGLSQAWTFTKYRSDIGSPTVADGVVYANVIVSGEDETIPSLDAFPASCGTGGASCAPLWTGPTGYDDTTLVDVAPAVAGGMVYAGADKLYVFPAAGCGESSCSPAWTGTTGAAPRSPTVVGGVVYVGTSAGKLEAFSASGCGAASCSPLWTAPTFGVINTAPAVAGGVVYVGTSDDHLYAFNASNGTLRWTAATGGAIDSSPAVANGVVYVGSNDDNLYAFNTSSGARLWEGATGGAVASSPAVAGSAVYVSSADGNLYAFSANGCGGPSCSPLWTGSIGQSGAPIQSSPAVAGGVVYVGGGAFAAAGCGAATCSPLVGLPTAEGTSPAVAGGVVYFGGSGSLQAFSLP